MSTRALQEVFCDAEEVIGVDTSPEMIKMARVVSRHDRMIRTAEEKVADVFKAANDVTAPQSEAIFLQKNAEHTDLPDDHFDLITIMYVFNLLGDMLYLLPITPQLSAQTNPFVCLTSATLPLPTQVRLP